MPDSSSFLATAARGTEPILARELRALGAAGVREEPGAVSWEGTAALGRRANLWLRTANHVLLRLASFPAASTDELYAGARAVPWEDRLTVHSTFAVTVQGRTAGIDHTHFAALRIKDAIADRLRERLGARPDVDPHDPAVRVVAHVSPRGVSLFLDTSGESLHIRKYRAVETEAPLRETLAAAIVLWSGWDRRRPLRDPLCGSGTIVIEAALLALGRAPGRRRRFGFQRWPSFGDAEARDWQGLLAEADDLARSATSPPALLGEDRDPAAVEAATRNAQAAGVAEHVRFEQADARSFAPEAPSGMVICNPPYGERLAPGRGTLEALYRALRRSLRRPGWVTVVLSGNPALPRLFGGRPAARLPLRNGALRCELLRWETRD